MSGEAREPRYQVQDGFRLPLGFPSDGLRSGRAYRPQSGDTFVSAYPKCGTTWTLNLTWLILHEGVPLGPDQDSGVEMPHLEEVGAEAVAARPRPRIIKTHLPFDLAPWSSEARYVYVTRNPFDCAVSFYHHTRGFPRHYDFAEGTFDAFFQCFLEGRVDFGDYFPSVRSWYERRDEPNVFFTTYERLKRDTRSSVLALAGFLGNDVRSAVERPEILEAVLEHASLRRMRQHASRWSSRRPDDATPFIRKGIVGDWRSTFSEDQARRLARRFQDELGDTDLAREWAQVMGLEL